MERAAGRRSFWLGAAFGALLVLAALAGGVAAAARRGVEVGVQAAGLAGVLRPAVEGALDRSLAPLRARLDAEGPAHLAREVNRRLRGISVRIGPFVAELPPEAARAIEGRVLEAGRAALAGAAEGLLSAERRRALGDEIAAAAQAALTTEFQRRPVLVRVLGVTIPVRLRVR